MDEGTTEDGQEVMLRFFIRLWCFFAGHATEPVKEMRNGVWRDTGLRQCENCGKVFEK